MKLSKITAMQVLKGSYPMLVKRDLDLLTQRIRNFEWFIKAFEEVCDLEELHTSRKIYFRLQSFASEWLDYERRFLCGIIPGKEYNPSDEVESPLNKLKKQIDDAK